MDDYMSIAALSVGMHNQMAATKLDTAVLKMAMDTQTTAMEGMIEAMDTIDVSAMTGIGGLVDILA